MHDHLKISDRLKIEALRRTVKAAFPQMLIALITWALIPHSSRYYVILTFGALVILLQQGFRMVYIQRFHKQFEKLLHGFSFLMALSLGTAFTWSILAALVFHEFGLQSEQGVIFLFNILGYIAATTYSFASMPRLQKLVSILIAWPMLLNAFIESSSVSRVMGGMFFVYLLYLFSVANVHSADLVHTYETEEKLRSEKEKLEKVINSVPGFVAMSDQNGHWIESSHSFKRLLNDPIIQAEVRGFRESQSETLAQEIAIHVEGFKHDYVVSFARLENPKNAIVLVGVPIDELKAIQKEMEIQRSKVEFAARLSTIGEMAGGIAHEVNNPLAIIVATTYQIQRFLEETLPHNESWQTPVRRIEETSHRISSIIKSLQYFSRQAENDPFESTAVALIVEKTLQISRQKFFNNDIQLVVSEIPKAKLVSRPVQIGQVLLNLLNNAYDAVLHSPIKRVELTIQETAAGIRFSVTDSGPGIPLPIQNRIFEPFFTTKEVGQGTGLGLSVSKGIIQDHHGEITLDSKPGHTKVEFFIPWKQPAQVQS